MIVLSQDEVRELLDLDELVDALAAAHAELSAGEASMPPRIAAFAQNDGLLGVMPAYLPSAGLACKLVTLFPRNRDRHTHQALICLFDAENGTPVRVKMIDGEEVSGVIEYYDQSFIRLTRDGAPNLFIFKHDIKYLVEEK